MKSSTASVTRELDILIVDDERPARSELHRMLLQLGMTGRIREAASLKEVLAELKDFSPGLLLLDIQMPGGDGFELLSRLGSRRPPVIFTTAYEQFAARAFELEAVDYLLKPFDESRLAKALARVHPTTESDTRLSAGDSILLKIDGECLLLPVESIDLIEVTDQGTRVLWGKNSGRIRKTIGRLEEQLDPRIFFRASRDTLVNLRSVTSLTLDDSGQLSALLPCKRTVVFSRRQGALFQKIHKI
jgi:two-component system LytT family response regulator